VGKGTVPVVVVEDVRGPLVVVGMTIGAVSGLLVPALAVVLERPGHVSGDEEVELAVVVEVEEAGARAPAAGPHTGARGDVAKRAVAVVAVQRVAAVIGHVEGGKAVVVVVPDRDPHAV